MGHYMEPATSSRVQAMSASGAESQSRLNAEDTMMAEESYPEDFDSFMASDVDTADEQPSAADRNEDLSGPQHAPDADQHQRASDGLEPLVL